MRAYAIALIFLCIQGAALLLQLGGVFPDIQEPVNTEAFDHIEGTIQDRTYYNQTEIDYTAEFERSGVSDALSTFGKALSVKHTMIRLGAEEAVAEVFSYFVYFVYIIGAIQLLIIRKGVGDVS